MQEALSSWSRTQGFKGLARADQRTTKSLTKDRADECDECHNFCQCPGLIDESDRVCSRNKRAPGISSRAGKAQGTVRADANGVKRNDSRLQRRLEPVNFVWKCSCADR